MSAATSFALPPAETHSGPFDVWNPGADEGDQHHYLLTLAAARCLAEIDSTPNGRVQVFDAEHHLVAWAAGGHWHGPAVA